MNIPLQKRFPHIGIIRFFNAMKIQEVYLFRIGPLRNLSTLLHMAHLTILFFDL